MTRSELQDENEVLRSTLEQARDDISDALDDEDDESESDEEEEAAA
jgi:hypothetical protein